MFRPEYESFSFAPITAKERRRLLRWLLDAVVATNAAFLQRGG